jgi:hypothetical protein
MRQEFAMHDLDDEDDYEVRDGEAVRVPMYLCDSLQRAIAGVDLLADHQPGFRLTSDEERAVVNDARQEMIDRATSAWRTKRRRRRDDDEDDDDELDRRRRRRSDDASSIADARRAAYETYCVKLRDAWKRPMDAAEPDNSSPPEVMRRHLRGDESAYEASAMLRHHLRVDPDDNAQARRDLAWSDYKTRLAGAWRRSPGVARAEPSIVGAGPRSMTVERVGKTDPGRASEIERQGEQWRHGA